MKHAIASVVFVVVTTCAAREALADWQVCNRAGFDVWVSVGWRNEPNGVHSDGWWKVSGCGCETVVTGKLFGNEVYVLAKRDDTGEYVVNGGPTLLCTKPTDAYGFYNARGNAKVCTTNEPHNVGVFQTFKFSDGASVTSKLTPARKPTDKICID